MSIEKTHAPVVINPAGNLRSAPSLTKETPGTSKPGIPVSHVDISEAQQRLHSDSPLDIRHSRVAKIRQAIADGSYRSDARNIASGIADSLAAADNDEN